MLVGRVIQTEGAGKDRNRLTRCVVLALRELMRQTEPNELAHDLAAFIGLALVEIGDTVDASVVAWEKRDYWVKADRFRMEWEWARRLGLAMQEAVRAEDWAQVALLSAQIGQRLMKVTIPQRHRLGTPWEGAWERLNA
ncbi:MAG: hypothetical protein LDL12_00225 [Anaerolinea sp.]|nr:hypothetical protein [Anaerolinea sp.]